MKKNSHVSLNDQRGSSLTEYLLYAALAGIVVVGATKMYNSSQNATQANQLLSDLQGIRSGAQSLATNGQYVGLSMDTLANAKALPSTIRKSGTNWLSNLNTNVTISVNASNSGKFDLVVQQVPAEICMKTISALDGSWIAKVGTSTLTLPAPDITTINAACSGTADITLTAA